MGRAGAGAPLAAALDTLARSLAPRAGSLAVTLFGDVIAPQGNSVWLGDLVAAMRDFGLNERQARTALFRLVREGWLEARAVGRRSLYAYTAWGQRQYARAAERIYAAGTPAWDGQWTLVSNVALAPAMRDELKRRLGWLGFGALGAGLLAHPRAPRAALTDTLRELECSEQVVVWHATAALDAPLVSLVRGAWRLDELGQRFADFVARFQPFEALLHGEVAPSEAFLLRVLLVHEYRRILLRSADLPPELLPGAWPGHAARALASRLYQALHSPACLHASAALANEHGPLPAPDAAFVTRFGGLVADPRNG
ncbi:MAG: phenylacetic acid degradation operon negative regulatory protein PaaX [Gammaproteobacteria bacterium]